MFESKYKWIIIHYLQIHVLNILSEYYMLNDIHKWLFNVISLHILNSLNLNGQCGDKNTYKYSNTQFLIIN